MDPSDILHLQIDQLLQGLVGQVTTLPWRSIPDEDKANPKTIKTKHFASEKWFRAKNGIMNNDTKTTK